MKTIRFTPETLALFSSASHDRNPLHLSEEYARRTPYGGRVVFGVLDALTAISEAPDRAATTLASIELEFFDTALLGIDYALQVTEHGPDCTVRVSDGHRPVLEAVLSFRAGATPAFDAPQRWQPLAEAKNRSCADLAAGEQLKGQYAPALESLVDLRSRLQLKQHWLSDAHVATLMWASYLIGMELPGRKALFSRLRIEFLEPITVSLPFEYMASVSEVSELGELTIEARLISHGKTWANATLAAHVREELTPATTESVERLVGRSSALSGKIAFVTGSSRGLGAALVRVLALHGSTVIANFATSTAAAEELRSSLSGVPGRVVLEPGNIADPNWCARAQQRLAANFGRLDVLICNASPPLLPLWLEPAAADRVATFVRQAVEMVSAPMMVFLPLLGSSKGWNILISSTAVSQPHSHFPHYVVAKSAAEALVRAASTEYRSVSSIIVRPSRLLTDLTNTPLGRRGALPPEHVAAAVLRRVLGTPCSGKLEILEGFSSQPAEKAGA
jgi:NAD(P)-dependent dehydrogenase (short-subunit alcohol dehydrogenase family)